MIQRMLASALVAGCAAGLLAALLHFAFVQKLILLGEAYETGAAVHFAGTATGGLDHSTNASATEGTATTEDRNHAADSEDASPLQRNALTVMFHALLYCSYGLVMVAGFALAERYGHAISAREGLLWGIAGFVAVQLAPAMGLEPELPGTMGAALADRQVWWVATVLCTAAAFAMIGYGRTLPWVLLAVVLLAAPHVVGAPEPEGFSGVAPPELAAAFAARSLGLGLAAWAVLGWLAGRFWGGRTV